jgi:quercetin dioxygenase-like cupin family protein
MSEQEMSLDIQHFFSSGVYVRQMHLPAGHFAQSHRHKFEHVSILAQGEVLLEVDGTTTRHCAPACITIAANAVHTITAMRDTTWFCIHATNETKVANIDYQLIQEQS